jgi:hypothetical protein
LPRSLTAPPQMSLQASANVAIERAKGCSRMPEPIVVSPALEVAIELANQLWQRFCTMSRRRHVPEFIQFTSQRFGTRFQPPVAVRSGAQIGC